METVAKMKRASIDTLIESSEREVKIDHEWFSLRYRYRSYIPSVTQSLLQRGFLVWQKNGQKSYLALTEKGRAFLASKKTEFKIKKEKWDNKWRIIIFDITEGKRFRRDRLREQLKTLKFVNLQKSVWLTPYSCEELVSLLRQDIKIGRSLIYLVTERFEGDIWLRKHFKLL